MSKDIDRLPFTEEGYENAKAILEVEYGQPTEIVNAYIKNIMELAIIARANPRKVKEFYKQLHFNVQSLDTLGRLADFKGNVRCTLNKLKGIKADLLHGNEGWKDWGFKDLLTELQKWTQINPVEETDAEKSEKDPSGKRNHCLPSIHINQGRGEETSVSTARMTNTGQLIVQRSQVLMRDRKSSQRKNCALIVPVQDIALMSVRTN